MHQEITTRDFRLVLKEELANRCRQNPRYSLRAFARDLKLAPSRLSEILSGKQGLSHAAAEQVAQALGYGPSEREHFCDLVDALHARSRQSREAAKTRLKRQELASPEYQLQLDAFKAIADWYHFGILELALLTDFQSDTKWIAKKLGISEFEAQLALDRLTRLGLVERKGARIHTTQDSGQVPGDVPSESIKKFHSQILAKAKDALYMQPIDEREYRSEIVAIDKSQLAEAKKMIREFQHKFCKTVTEAEAKDGLYCLAIQFFDLSDRG